MAKTTTKNIKDKTKVKKARTTAKKSVSKVTAKKTKTAAVKKTAVPKKSAAVKKTVIVKKAAPVKKASVPKTKAAAIKKAVVTKVKGRNTASTASSYKSLISIKDALKKMKGYGKRDLAKFKKVILEKREDIIKQLQALKEQMMDSSTGQYVNENSPYSLHMAEQGTDAQEREKLYLWAQRENKFLGYLDDALQRIENGTYGICIDSINNPDESPHLVPKDRLFAVPHTQHCVACKMKKNKNKR